MHLLEMEIKHRCNQALEMGFGFYGLAKLFAQDWEGDVTIVMNASLAQVSRLPNDENKTLIDFSPFSAEEIMALLKSCLCQVVFTDKRCGMNCAGGYHKFDVEICFRIWGLARSEDCLISCILSSLLAATCLLQVVALVGSRPHFGRQ
jgi:hypothetical protein